MRNAGYDPTLRPPRTVYEKVFCPNGVREQYTKSEEEMRARRAIAAALVAGCTAFLACRARKQSTFCCTIRTAGHCSVTFPTSPSMSWPIICVKPACGRLKNARHLKWTRPNAC